MGQSPSEPEAFMGKPTVISLFSGAGGLDYGLEAAGYATAVAVDFDSDACATLRASRDWTVLEKDLVSLSPAAIRSAVGLSVGEADLLAAGPPCQPFSRASAWARGAPARIDDPRAQTLIAFMSAWRDALPRVVLMESVPGFVHRGSSDALGYVEREIAAINRSAATEYRAQWAVLNAADYGVPQVRRRFVLVAARDGDTFEFPRPTHRRSGRLPPGGPSTAPYRTTWDALGDLSTSEMGLEPTGRWASLLPSIPEGENYLFHTERGDGAPLFGWRRRYWSFLLKLAKGRPSWTIPAEPGPATGPFHWENRRLSTRELSRLQTIPDDVEVVGSYRSAHRQLGNAVPSLLAEVVGRAIGEQFLDQPASQHEPELLPVDRGSTPPPERPAPVPSIYLSLADADTAHPGTALGRAAVARARPTLVPAPTTPATAAVVRANRSQDTRPERKLRSVLHARGYRFRKSFRIGLEGGSVRADIVFPRRRLVVFVDGCFRHQCPWHGNVHRAHSRYWGPKLARNVERDRRVSQTLERAGWDVVRIWEHVNSEDAADRVESLLKSEFSHALKDA